jgi:hypothetical protein
MLGGMGRGELIPTEIDHVEVSQVGRLLLGAPFCFIRRTTVGKRYREREERRELQATIEIGSTSSDDILRFHGLPITWSSFEYKKKGRGKEKTDVRIEVDVRGQDIFARNQPGKKSTEAWEKFLLFKGYSNRHLISLVNDEDRLTEEYYAFLIYVYEPDRYRNLDAEGKAWFLKVVRLAVKYHIMENKLTGYLQSFADENDDEDYFLNEYALYFYTLMRAIKKTMQGTARTVNYMIKEPEKEEYYLKKFFDAHYQQLRRTPFPQRDAVLRLFKAEDNDDDGTMEVAAV